MATLFKLPMLGQTMQEGTILKWYKARVTRWKDWETLLEVMTDKVNMEVDPQVSGILRKILAAEGTDHPGRRPRRHHRHGRRADRRLLAEAGSESFTTETRSGEERSDGGRSTGEREMDGRRSAKLARCRTTSLPHPLTLSPSHPLTPPHSLIRAPLGVAAGTGDSGGGGAATGRRWRFRAPASKG